MSNVVTVEVDLDVVVKTKYIGGERKMTLHQSLVQAAINHGCQQWTTDAAAKYSDPAGKKQAQLEEIAKLESGEKVPGNPGSHDPDAKFLRFVMGKYHGMKTSHGVISIKSNADAKTWYGKIKEHNPKVAADIDREVAHLREMQEHVDESKLF